MWPHTSDRWLFRRRQVCSSDTMTLQTCIDRETELERRRLHMELSEGQSDLLNTMQEAVAGMHRDEQMFTSMVRLALIDRFKELFQWRNLRNQAFNEGDMETVKTCNRRMDNILRFLKENDVPYHPAFGSRQDWDAL